MKEILIVGLGLIGASYCKALKLKEYKILGYDLDKKVLDYALENNIIDETDDLDKLLKRSSFIVLSIYPKDIINFLNLNKNYFKNGVIITDTTGVKSCYYDLVNDFMKSNKKSISYILCHPMAGKEKLGIKNSSAKLFLDSNFLIIKNELIKEECFKKVENLALDLGCNKITYTTALEHDKMIGFTSQLTHLLAVSLMNAKDQNEILKFTGDSYRDLTRIAFIDINLWSELFLLNKDILVDIITDFSKQLEIIKNVLKNDNKDELLKILIKAKKEREKMVNGKIKD